LDQQGWLDLAALSGPAFYLWPRPDRVILIFDPLVKNIDRVLTRNFRHRLSTALSGRRVVATNSRGIFLQVAYWPAPVTDLTPRPLDLAQQPGPLHVPLGVTSQGPLWLPLPEIDAALIGGARRMGKTRFLHGWIQALIHGGQAQILLWDGKEGVEFGRYAHHSGVHVVQELAEGLAALTQELVRRSALFKAAGAPALPDYVRRTGERLPPLVLIIDEAAFVPETAQGALADLVARGGAFGVHPILATQRPDAQAVQALIKTNLSTRIALPVPAVHDSQVILGRPGAEKLAKRPGRLLFTWAGRLVEAQAFLVDLPELPSEDATRTATLLDPAEVRLVTAAMKELAGWFKIRQLADVTGESRDRINALAQRWETQGLLTPVQRNDQGHVLGRQVTPALLQAAGLGGQAEQAE
jgi:hypothetical protein